MPSASVEASAAPVDAGKAPIANKPTFHSKKSGASALSIPPTPSPTPTSAQPAPPPPEPSAKEKRKFRVDL
jgi:hypothetical protein